MPLYLNTPGAGPQAGLLSRILAAIVTAVLLALFFVFGFAIFLVLLVVALVGGAIFSWRFRKVRREMESMLREASESSAPFPGADSVNSPGSSANVRSNVRPGHSRGETLEGEYEVIDREG